MRLGQLAVAASLLALGACTASKPQGQTNPEGQDIDRQTIANRSSDDRPVNAPPVATSTAQRPTVDPKSTDAALQLVRGFVDLINRGRYEEAYMLLGAGAPPRNAFEKEYKGYSDVRATIGNPGPQEGAAGSIYLTVPLHVSGTLNGKHVDRDFNAIVRRVNDVDGSTEAQRHWHIERVEPQQR